MKRVHCRLGRDSWSLILRRYLPCLALGSLLWEIAQLPLYTLWAEASPRWIAFSVAHCTVGDVLIGAATLLTALRLTRAGDPANWPVARVIALTIGLATAYTMLSEWLNLSWGNWAYSSSMPVLPGVGVGLAPLVQWLVVPLAAFWWSLRKRGKR